MATVTQVQGEALVFINKKLERLGTLACEASFIKLSELAAEVEWKDAGVEKNPLEEKRVRGSRKENERKKKARKDVKMVE